MKHQSINRNEMTSNTQNIVTRIVCDIDIVERTMCARERERERIHTVWRMQMDEREKIM